MTAKQCSCCKLEKPLDHFYKDATKKLGVSSRCMLCAKAATKKWEQENKERKNANSKAWAAKNKQKRRKTSQLYQHKVGREEMSKRLREWREANPEAARAALARRRARRLEAGGTYTADDVLRLFVMQKGTCTVCRERLPKSYHVDHIQPLSRGGSNGPDNLQLLCPPCNLTKNARDPVEFMQSKGFLC